MRIGIFGSEYQLEKQSIIRRVFSKLAALGAEVYVDADFSDFLRDTFGFEPAVAGILSGDEFDLEVAISMGGDGTFLRTAARVNRQNIPILGINTGRLGFLADVGSTEVEETLEEGRTILGYAGTEAERYARENGVPFVDLGAAPGAQMPPPSLSQQPGDSGTVPGMDPGIPSDGTFADVPASSYCYEPVTWAVEAGITYGTGADAFSPDLPCSQCEILTFLWRSMLSPEPGTENPYTSPYIDPDQFYYPAILWAWEQGVVDDPDLVIGAGCTRRDVVVYLWRLAGCPDPVAMAGVNAFQDVPPDADYADAVRWAVEWSITSGTDPLTFSPDKVCTRGEIVTFLWRYVVGDPAPQT